MLFDEFDKILSGVSVRLAEGLQETEILIEQTVDQLLVLLTEHPGNGFVLRYLIENRGRVDEVFGRSLDALLSEIEGDAGAPHRGAQQRTARVLEATRGGLRPGCGQARALRRGGTLRGAEGADGSIGGG